MKLRRPFVVCRPRAGSAIFLLVIRRPPRATQSRSSAASDVYKRQGLQLVGFGDKGVDEAGGLDVADRLATHKEDTLVTATGNANIGRLSLTDTVDDATHEGNGHWLHDLTQPCLELSHKGQDVGDFTTATCRARHNLCTMSSQVESGQQHPCRIDLQTRVAADGVPDRIADAVEEQGADAGAALDKRLSQRSCLRDPKMKRVVAAACNNAHGFHHLADIAALHGHHDIMKVRFLQESRFSKRFFSEGLGSL